MLIGMKFLEGMAYDAAVKRGGGTRTGEAPPPTMAINRLSLRSAPRKGEGVEEEEKQSRRRCSGEPSLAAAVNQVFEREEGIMFEWWIWLRLRRWGWRIRG